MIPGPGKTTSVAPLPQSLIRWRNACKVSFRVKVKVKRGTQYQDEIVHNCKHRWRKACKVKFIQGNHQNTISRRNCHSLGSGGGTPGKCTSWFRQARESSGHNCKHNYWQYRIKKRKSKKIIWQAFVIWFTNESLVCMKTFAMSTSFQINLWYE